MFNARAPQMVWQRVPGISVRGFEIRATPCPEQHHWIALFLESGQLAYWQCRDCGLLDRDRLRLAEDLDSLNLWIEAPLILSVYGVAPPHSVRRWQTPAGTVLWEGDPSSIHFYGLALPGLETAHTYEERAADGAMLTVYAPRRERRGPNHYTLTRYQVLEAALVRFEYYCFEESTFDVPNAHLPQQTVLLTGLQPLPI